MIAFAEEHFADIEAEIAPLWRAHYDEIAQDKDAIPLDPHWEEYRARDKDRTLAIVTARRDGALIGYVFALAGPHLHYKSTTFANLDLYYLRPDCRGGRTFVRMMGVVEKVLRDAGVVKVFGNTKIAHDQGRVFRALGWREAERIFVKLLETA